MTPRLRRPTPRPVPRPLAGRSARLRMVLAVLAVLALIAPAPAPIVLAGATTSRPAADAIRNVSGTDAAPPTAPTSCSARTKPRLAVAPVDGPFAGSVAGPRAAGSEPNDDTAIAACDMARPPIRPDTLPASASSATAASEPAWAQRVLLAAGDISGCGVDNDQATARILDTTPGKIIALGDLAYDDGTWTEFIRCYGPTWGRHRSRTRPVPGNHEYHTSGAKPYYGYFGAAAGDPLKGYYAFDAGGWRIYALNSNCSRIGGCAVGSPQERWLRADLAAHPRKCVLAYWHHPLFSSGRHGNHAAVAPLWQTLDAAGAELVLSGHDHIYERFAPQTAAGVATPAGMTEIVVGTGGRGTYPLRTIRPNSRVRNNTTFGVLRLALRAERLVFRFLAVPGSTFTDSGTIPCR
jgi:hypothetical protein